MLNLLFTVLIQYFDKKSTLACGRCKTLLQGSRSIFSSLGAIED